MKRTLIKESLHCVDQDIEIRGWVSVIRKMGKMLFLDVRDFSGTVQVFVDSKYVADVQTIKPESVVAIQAKVTKRPNEKLYNKQLGELGTIELQYRSHELLSAAQTPPFEVLKDTKKVDEELRLTYRYLDLRNERMRNNIRLRDKMFSALRSFLHNESFVEIETPSLTKGTPEGAREYIVPSRNYPGTFYVLPQSPQQFKQLLMVSGFERYFQIARCFRDEDQRGDRQPEFTQLDMEMSFVDAEDVLSLSERMLIDLVKTVAPEKHITQTPFPRITYAESMKKYGNDKPDIRKDKNDKDELGFVIVTDFPLFEQSPEEKRLVPMHHLFTAPHPDDVALLDSTPEKARGQLYDIALNGFEIASGSIRIHDQKLQSKIFDLLQIPRDEAEIRFGHMLRAFSYGVPPHGGIAFGADRMVALFAGEENIREVIAFPKTGDARDPLMGAPTQLPSDQLDDVHIQIKKE